MKILIAWLVTMSFGLVQEDLNTYIAKADCESQYIFNDRNNVDIGKLILNIEGEKIKVQAKTSQTLKAKTIVFQAIGGFNNNQRTNLYGQIDGLDIDKDDISILNMGLHKENGKFIQGGAIRMNYNGHTYYGILNCRELTKY